MKEIKPGIYKHFKGMLYKVHFVVRHSESLEYLVVYEALYDNPNGKYWVRPYEMFIGDKIFEDGTKVKRFEYLGKTLEDVEKTDQ